RHDVGAGSEEGRGRREVRKVGGRRPNPADPRAAVGRGARGAARIRSSWEPGAASMIEELLFDAALERTSPAERQAFLDRACAGDLALRKRVVRLLAADEKRFAILDQLAGPPGAPEDAAGRRPGGVLPDGRVDTLVAGRYKLL